MAETISVDELLAQAAAQVKTNEELIAQTRATQKRGEELQAAREKNLQEATPDAVILKLTEENAKLKAQNQSRSAATSAGVNMDATNQIVTGMLAKSADAAKRAVDLADDIRSSEEKPFLPWLADQMFVVPFKEQELAANLKVVGVANESLQKINATVQQQAQTNNAIAEVRTNETVAANMRQIARTAQDELLKLQIDGLRTNSQNVEAIFRMTNQQLDAYTRIKQIQNSEEQLELSRNHYRLAVAKWEEEFSDRKEKKEHEADIANTVNAGLVALGLPKLEPKKIKARNSVGGEANKILQRAYVIGAAGLATNNPLIGDTPIQAAEIIIQSQAPLTSEMKSVKDFLLQSIPAALSKLPPTIDPKDKIVVSAHVNKVVNDAARKQQQEIKTGDASNIYAGSSLKALESRQALQDSKEVPFIGKVLLPAMATDTGPVNPQDLVSKSIAAIQQGITNPTEAANGIALTFRALAAVNNETRRYRQVGLPEQTKYPVTFTHQWTGSPSVFGMGAAATYKYDMMDPREVSILLSRELSASVSKQTNRPVYGN